MKSVKNENQPLISVIVPVYNVEQYLDHCVESIINQTYKNLEIILVDDGSPDNCPAMCDAWAKKDSRIRVIHKANGGSGQARNVALDIVRGDFVAFVDSDDYIAPQIYEYLMGMFDSTIDIVECGYLMTDNDDVEFDNTAGEYDGVVYTTSEAMQNHICDRIFRQIIWNKLYRKAVIGCVRFPNGKFIDDEFWTYRVIGNANKLVHSDRRLYAYRQQNQSVMHAVYSLKRLHAIEAKCLRLEYVSDKFSEMESDARINLWFSCLYQGQQALRNLPKQDCKSVLDDLQDVLKQYPLSKRDLYDVKNSHKVWLCLAAMSMKHTCNLRNIMRIGQ